MTDLAPVRPPAGLPAATAPLLVPLSLRVDPIARLLLLDFHDDPLYTGVEVQWLDDPGGAGTGIVVLAALPDRRVDLYFDPALRIDPERYAVGAGLAGWRAARMREGRFEVTEAGAQVDVRFTLLDGRELELRVHERQRSAARLSLLAPMGHGLRDPAWLPFFWLEDFAFLRPSTSEIVVRVGGRRRRPVRAGAPWRLPRCCAAPLTAALNAAVDGPLAAVDVDEPGVVEVDGTLVEVVEDAGEPAIARIAAAHGGGRLALVLDPPLPSPAALPPGPRLLGRVALTVDGVEQLGGRYRCHRDGDRVVLSIAVDRPWRPQMPSRRQRALFGVLRVMRTWPTTYRWEAELDLAADPPAMRSRWWRSRS